MNKQSQQNKDIQFSEDARQELLKGVEALRNTVAVTHGPSGKNVLIQKSYGAPVLTKDGVSVAQEVFLDNPLQNMGAQLVKEVAQNVANSSGDGTTTVTVLAHAIFKEGMKHVTAGANPVQMKSGMQKAQDALLKELEHSSKKITTTEEVQQIGTISANGDSKIGSMIAEAMDRVGKDGVITVEEAKGFDDELEVSEGMNLESGYISPYFITDTSKMQAVLENTLVLTTNYKIMSMTQILPALEKAQITKRPILIICEDVEGDVLSTLVTNKIRGIVDVCVIKAQGVGKNRTDILEDVSVLCDGTTILSETGKKLERTDASDLGSAEKIIVHKDKTTIIVGNSTKSQVQARIDEIRVLLDEAKSEYEIQNYKLRLAKLSGGVAVIKVGAPTETEMKEKKDRVDDALGATQAAVDDGILVGGGFALLRAEQNVPDLGLEKDQNLGAEILLGAVSAPAESIITNTGHDAKYIITSTLNEHSDEFGWDASTFEVVDMYKDGIIDALKVQKEALKNAVSVASMLLTTEATITYKED